MLDPQVTSELRCYSAEQVPMVWHLYRDAIQRAVDRGSDYTLEDIYALLVEKHAQLWTFKTSAVVTSINVSRKERFCTIIAAGGEDMDEWLCYLPTLEEWAANEGAKSIRIYGRRGWARKLNYDIDYTRMSKRL